MRRAVFGIEVFDQCCRTLDVGKEGSNSFAFAISSRLVLPSRLVRHECVQRDDVESSAWDLRVGDSQLEAENWKPRPFHNRHKTDHLLHFQIRKRNTAVAMWNHMLSRIFSRALFSL